MVYEQRITHRDSAGLLSSCLEEGQSQPFALSPPWLPSTERNIPRLGEARDGLMLRRLSRCPLWLLHPSPAVARSPRHPSAILGTIFGKPEAELVNSAAAEARCTFASVPAKSSE